MLRSLRHVETGTISKTSSKAYFLNKRNVKLVIRIQRLYIGGCKTSNVNPIRSFSPVKDWRRDAIKEKEVASENRTLSKYVRPTSKHKTWFILLRILYSGATTRANNNNLIVSRLYVRTKHNH